MGVLDRGERCDDNETGLKVGGGIEMSTTVLSIYAMHRSSFAYCILLTIQRRISSSCSSGVKSQPGVGPHCGVGRKG